MNKLVGFRLRGVASACMVCDLLESHKYFFFFVLGHWFLVGNWGRILGEVEEVYSCWLV